MQVPADAWQVGPSNRWAYQHVDEVAAVQTVARDPHGVRRWPAHDGGLDDLIDPLVADAWVDGVLVAHGGTIVGERYANEMTPDTLHLSQSVGKSVLGLVVGALVGRGLLRRDQPVTEHVPEVADSGFAGANVGHLLDMTASTDFVEDYEHFWRYDAACGWHPPAAGVPGTVIDYLASIGPGAWTHGERFHYVSPDTDLLGLVAERAAGRQLPQLVSELLWRPMGARRDAQLTMDRDGTAVISGGICACLRDYARLGQLVADGGAGVIPSEWIDGLGAGSAGAWAAPVDPDEPPPGASGYANQWWRIDGRPSALGIHGQRVTADREAGIVIAVLSSQPAASDDRLAETQRRFCADVIERLSR